MKVKNNNRVLAEEEYKIRKTYTSDNEKTILHYVFQFR